VTGPADRLDRWSDAWRGGGAAPPGVDLLRHRVASDTRRLVWTTVVQAVLTVALAVSVSHVMRGHLGAAHVIWGAGVLLLLVAAWAFAWINRRGIWQPYGHTTSAFLQLTRERCRRRLAMATFMLWLAGTNFGLTLVLVWWQTAGSRTLPLHWADRSGFFLAAGLVVGAVAWAVRARRAVRSELRQLDVLEKGDDGDDRR
jgi:hypothetical protein